MTSKYTNQLTLATAPEYKQIGNIFCYFLDPDFGGHLTFNSMETTNGLWIAHSPVTAETQQVVGIFLSDPVFAFECLQMWVAEKELPENFSFPTLEEVTAFLQTSKWALLPLQEFLVKENLQLKQTGATI
jgi:hypothetical protein